MMQEWITALRSGRYQQGYRRLRYRYSDGFCCLGVLCDVVDPNAWDSLGWNGHTYLPPNELLARIFGEYWADWTKLLSRMNDGEDATFEEIADLLESL